MKDIKVTTIQSAAEPQTKGKTSRTVTGPSFDETLQDTVARVTDLKVQAGAAVNSEASKVANIKDELNTAGEVFDQLMREQENLSKLYQNLQEKKES